MWSDGYRSFLTVIAPNGGVAKSKPGTGVWRQSGPGRYRIRRAGAECDPGCANLMEPSDQCTRDLAVTGAATEVTITAARAVAARSTPLHEHDAGRPSPHA